MIYNKDVIQGKNYGKDIHARIGIIDLTYKLKPKHSIRTELQYLSADKNEAYNQDQGDWMMALIEYTISPHWFFYCCRSIQWRLRRSRSGTLL